MPDDAPPADSVPLTDLDVIQRYSLAVRAATAPRADVIAALRADLAWLEETAPKPRPPAAPKPRPTAAPKAARKAPATKAAAKQAAATKTATPRPARKVARADG